MTSKAHTSLLATVLVAANAFGEPAAVPTDPATCAANLIILEESAKAAGRTDNSDALTLMLASAYTDTFEKYGDQMKPVVQRELKKYRSLIDENGNPLPKFERTMDACIELYSKRAGLEE
jgi:hypothetical protein